MSGPENRYDPLEECYKAAHKQAAEIARLRAQRDKLLEACDFAIACLQGECPGTARRVLLPATIAAKEGK